MPQAEMFPSPPRRPSREGDVPSDAVDLLRAIAKWAAEAAADPSVAAPPDHHLLQVCDSLMLLERAADKAEAEHYRAPLRSADGEAAVRLRRARRACANAMREAAKLPATTAAGIYAKAVAAARAGPGANHLCHSLARDLLANPELRSAIWPAARRT